MPNAVHRSEKDEWKFTAQNILTGTGPKMPPLTEEPEDSQISQEKPFSVMGDDGAKHQTGMKLFWIVLALCLSVFLEALAARIQLTGGHNSPDLTIVTTAIPTITDHFHSLQDVGWYGSGMSNPRLLLRRKPCANMMFLRTAYLLTSASLQLLFGRIYSQFTIKWVYLSSIVIFELGSLICGVANRSSIFIIGRAIAGVGSAGIFTGSLVILSQSVRLERRPFFTGIIGSMYGIASVVGPVLGGLFANKLTWRWCFLINLPLGAVAALVIITLLEPTRHSGEQDTKANRLRQCDPFGSVLFIAATVCLLLALQWGGTQHDWNSWRVILLFCSFGILILVFVLVQYIRQECATVPPRIFLQRTVWSSSLFGFCLGGAALSSVYFLPIWFQAVKGVSPVVSGFMMLPILISFALVSVLSGILVTVAGYYTPFMLAGTVFCSFAYGLMSTATPDTSMLTWPAVLAAYNGAISKTFVVCAVVSAVGIMGALSAEWKSVRASNESSKL
ncbi:Efflux pump roqT [Metarhizium anisopliae]